MPIGVVSDDDFLSELDKGEKSPVPELKPAQLPEGQVIDINRGGRSIGDNNVPESLRTIIGEESVNSRGAARQFAGMFDISNSSVSAYSNGATSTATYHKQNKQLAAKLNSAKIRVANKARKKLDLAIENITEDKLMDANLKDLALVAKAMSGVVKDMEPSTDRNDTGINVNGPSIIMYNPGFVKESQFDTIEVNE